jgi:hypothetical protein
LTGKIFFRTFCTVDETAIYKWEIVMPSNDEKKLVTITVNTEDHSVPHAKISYSAVVEFAFPGGSKSGAIYIVKYSRGNSSQETGTLAPNEDVMVKDGMRFRVSPTGES